MKALVTGVNGQLGHDVLRELCARNIDCLGAGRVDFDITDCEATHNFIMKYKPDVVIHCAAYTAVDKAEVEQELCHKVNVSGTEHIASACRNIDAKMVYISTDYVFPGVGEKYYEVDADTGPVNVYGKSKLDGEAIVRENLEKHFIVRISWVFGENGNNFIKTMLRLGKEREIINVVCDQIGSPTYTGDLALLICDMIFSMNYGTYHATNEGICSWAHFAEEIFKLAGYTTKVNSILTSDFPAKAVRPHNSRLSKSSLEKAGFSRLPTWQDATARFLRKLQFK